jgi:hypothetical protein
MPRLLGSGGSAAQQQARDLRGEPRFGGFETRKHSVVEEDYDQSSAEIERTRDQLPMSFGMSFSTTSSRLMLKTSKANQIQLMRSPNHWHGNIHTRVPMRTLQ